MQKLSAHLKPYTKHFIIGPSFKLLEAVLELFMPIYMAKIIDIGIANVDTTYIYKLGLVMLINCTIGLISAVICQYSASIAAQGFGTSLRNAVFKKVMGLSFSQVDKYGTDTLFSRITNDVMQLQTAVNMTIRIVIRAPFICIGSVIAAFIINVKLGFIILTALPLYSVCLILVMRKASPLYTKVQKSLDMVSRSLSESLSGVRIIRAFSRENAETERFVVKNDNLADSSVAVGKVSSLTNPFTSLILNVSIIVIVWFGGVQVSIGDLTQGELLAFISYLTQMLAALIVVANLVVLFTRAYSSLIRVKEVLDTEMSNSEGEGKFEESNSTDIAVEFDNVTFSYNGTEPDIENISFSLQKGKSLGVIGATGAGKSTLVKLISRFYLPDSGKVLINGTCITEYDKITLRSIVGAVPQKTELFSGTIAENIRWGNMSADDSQIEKSAQIAQAAEFIDRLKNKYNTVVKSGGVNFSGGQRQRIAIARAIVRNPQILILDDSASALDYSTDANLRKAISTECAGITSIIISQRVWAIKDCDTILVLDDGKIVGTGTHTSLVEGCAEYKEIVLSQQGGGELHG